MDNNTRKELLYKARAAGYPGSILDVFAAYSQGKDLIAEYQQEQRMQQAQQMSDFVGAQTLQQPQAQPQFQPQAPQVPSSPPSVQANVPLNVQPANTELVDSSKQTNVGIVPNQTGSYKGRVIFAKGGFKTDPPQNIQVGNPDENRLYTYKNDPGWFDNRAVYNTNLKYNDQIRRAVYSGNYGYNPVTGVLEKLSTNQRTKVDAETKRREAEGENRKAYNESIVAAGFNPETFAKPTAEEEKAYQDRILKDYIIQGHNLAINNPAFKAAAYFTPAGMALGAIEGAAHLGVDAGKFIQNPSWKNAGAVGMDALMAFPLAKPALNPTLNEIKATIRSSKKSRMQSLADANKWSEEWASHPGTFERFRQALIEANKTDPALAREMAKDFDLAFKFKGRAAEYPLGMQILDGPIHRGNSGVSYIHGYPRDTYKFFLENYPEGKTSMMDRVTNPQRQLTANWVSRTLNPEQRVSTAIHENTHDWIPNYLLKSSGQEKMFLDNLSETGKEFSDAYRALEAEGKTTKQIENILGREKAYAGYLTDPTEIHARIMELRKQYGITPSDKISQEFSDQILDDVLSNKTQVDPAFGYMVSNKGFNNIMNKAFGVTGVGGAGYLMSKQQKKKGGFKGMGPGCPDGYFKDINGNCIPLLKPIEEGVDGFEGQDLAQYYRSFPAQNSLCKEPGCFNYEAGKTGYQKNPRYLSSQLAYAGSGIANSKDYIKSYKPSDDDEILRNKYVEQHTDPTKDVPGPFFGSTINIETDEERKERAKTVNPDKVRKDFYTRLEDRFVNDVSNFYKFSEYGEQPILSYEDLNKVSEGYLDEFLSDPNISEEAKQKVINTIGQDSYKQYIKDLYSNYNKNKLAQITDPKTGKLLPTNDPRAQIDLRETMWKLQPTKENPKGGTVNERRQALGYPIGMGDNDLFVDRDNSNAGDLPMSAMKAGIAGLLDNNKNLTQEGKEWIKKATSKYGIDPAVIGYFNQSAMSDSTKTLSDYDPSLLVEWERYSKQPILSVNMEDDKAPVLSWASREPILTKYSPDMEGAVPVTGAIKTGFLDNKKKKKLGGVKDKCYTCQKIHKVKK